MGQTDKEEFEAVLALYRQKVAELEPGQQQEVKAISAAMHHLVNTTGRQGVIAAGLFTFEKLLEHLNAEPKTE